jgi:hypothetical protein
MQKRVKNIIFCSLINYFWKYRTRMSALLLWSILATVCVALLLCEPALQSVEMLTTPSRAALTTKWLQSCKKGWSNSRQASGSWAIATVIARTPARRYETWQCSNKLWIGLIILCSPGSANNSKAWSAIFFTATLSSWSLSWILWKYLTKQNFAINIGTSVIFAASKTFFQSIWTILVLLNCVARKSARQATAKKRVSSSRSSSLSAIASTAFSETISPEFSLKFVKFELILMLSKRFCLKFCSSTSFQLKTA